MEQAEIRERVLKKIRLAVGQHGPGASDAAAEVLAEVLVDMRMLSSAVVEMKTAMQAISHQLATLNTLLRRTFPASGSEIQ